ncbi:MAG: hypothetical protein EXQ58_06635 [Acidobacteria bacterium]|nr:hypothetical protein [Acidobacteriota bacterium]
MFTIQPGSFVPGRLCHHSQTYGRSSGDQGRLCACAARSERAGRQSADHYAGCGRCTYLYQDKVFKLPAFRVKVVDTACAGDCFHGAFCFALSRGFALPEAVGLASAVAQSLAPNWVAGAGFPPTIKHSTSCASRLPMLDR